MMCLLQRWSYYNGSPRSPTPRCLVMSVLFSIYSGLVRFCFGCLHHLALYLCLLNTHFVYFSFWVLCKKTMNGVVISLKFTASIWFSFYCAILNPNQLILVTCYRLVLGWETAGMGSTCIRAESTQYLQQAIFVVVVTFGFPLLPSQFTCQARYACCIFSLRCVRV